MTQDEKRAAGKEKARAAIERLDAGVLELVESDERFKEYLRLSAKQHDYSWGNRLLIMLQRPDAGIVAGYKRWQELGRPVLKGSKGIQILAPMVKKFHGEPGMMDDRGREYDENGEAVGVVGFRVTYVFSVNDTDGPPIGKPEVPAESDDSEAGAELERQLLERAAELGASVTVRTGDDLGNAVDGKPAGWCLMNTGEIVVNAALPAGARAKVLAHELAHYVAGKMDRRDAETVAEGAAFVVAAAVGMDTLAFSAPYIAGWSGDLGRVRGLLDSIAKVSDRILEGFNLPGLEELATVGGGVTATA